LYVPRLVVLALLLSGCGFGAGVIALSGATEKHTSYQYVKNCRQTGVSTATCEDAGTETVNYNPNHFHFGALLGVKLGTASASYATDPNTTGNASSRTIEPYFDVNFQFDRFGLALEYGWVGQNLDGMTGLSYGAWPLGLIGMYAVGPLTAFAGIDLLTATSMSDNALFDADLGGYRLLAGIKGHAFALFDDKVDVYPRLELQLTRASGDNGVSYSATGVAFSIELGL
jgi:hypothetical protein